MIDKQKVFRLAFRQEGDFWNAYLAQLDSMTDAKLLGAIRMSIVTKNSQLRESFMSIMRTAMDDAIAAALPSGTRAEWGGEETAPEHERAGNA